MCATEKLSSSVELKTKGTQFLKVSERKEEREGLAVLADTASCDGFLLRH